MRALCCILRGPTYEPSIFTTLKMPSSAIVLYWLMKPFHTDGLDTRRKTDVCDGFWNYLDNLWPFWGHSVYLEAKQRLSLNFWRLFFPCLWVLRIFYLYLKFEPWLYHRFDFQGKSERNVCVCVWLCVTVCVCVCVCLSVSPTIHDLLTCIVLFVLTFVVLLYTANLNLMINLALFYSIHSSL